MFVVVEDGQASSSSSCLDLASQAPFSQPGPLLGQAPSGPLPASIQSGTVGFGMKIVQRPTDSFVYRSLTEEELQEYRENGYHYCEGLLTDLGLARMRDECMAAWEGEKRAFDARKTWLQNSLLPNIHGSSIGLPHPQSACSPVKIVSSRSRGDGDCGKLRVRWSRASNPDDSEFSKRCANGGKTTASTCQFSSRTTCFSTVCIVRQFPRPAFD